MIHSVLHQLFLGNYIHEIFHFLSGCVGSFIGTWGYFRLRKTAVTSNA
ncbi:MAG TPA: hypothetical protein VMD25_12855 [Acidobacteriaceae bacterium]|nr:hypothetical protein [Acidobacteriaceae bacterium]